MSVDAGASTSSPQVFQRIRKLVPGNVASHVRGVSGFAAVYVAETVFWQSMQ